MKDISIVTICKNAEKSIVNTIKSVMAQIDISYEYIIVDGGSKDSTLSIIKSQAGFNQIGYLISEPDMGISDAMNKGARMAKGKLIFFLHSGDVLYSPQTLTLVYKNFITNNWVWASGNLILSRDGEPLIGMQYMPDSLERLKFKNCIPHQATFMTKQLFDMAGGFDVSLKQAMDYDLWLRLRYQFGVASYTLNEQIAFFDVDGTSSDLLPLILGNIRAHSKARNYCNDINSFNTLLLVLGIVYHWFKYRFNVYRIHMMSKNFP